MTPTIAAKIISEEYQSLISRDQLQAWIKSGKCPFGQYITKVGNVNGKYQIAPTRLHAYYQARDLICECPHRTQVSA